MNWYENPDILVPCTGFLGTIMFFIMITRFGAFEIAFGSDKPNKKDK